MDTLKAVWRFVLHTLVGSFLFLLITFVAVGLNLFGDWVAGQKVHPYLGYGVGVLEFFLYALDVFLFVVFECTEAYILIRSILHSASSWRG